MRIDALLERLWYRGSWPGFLLLPLSAVYYTVFAARRLLYRLAPPAPLPVPVIVVGNLSVGGTGKTPLVIHLAQWFTAQGRRVGIVSRGYRAAAGRFPREVAQDDDAAAVGDEPRLIANATDCPVAIGPARREAALLLIDKHGVDLVVSDDGLQHFGLPRTLEIVVVDGRRGFGNGMLLPAGPLRELVARLHRADFVVVNGAENASELVPGAWRMALRASAFRHLASGRTRQPGHFAGRRVHACAGIGNPQSFFRLLESLGVDVCPHAFPDHHALRAQDLDFNDELPIVMTEKDGVKYPPRLSPGVRTPDEVWVLETEVVPDPGFGDELMQKLGITNNG